mgnify:CR=1 FL=1
MSKFNSNLWQVGKIIEDEIKPHLDKFLDCDFQRSADVYDILDFHDEDKKKIVEVKGRRISSTSFAETIITCGKITEGLMEMERGFEVYFFFVFTDKTLYFKLDAQNCDFDMKRTGTAFIPHYLIPIKDLTEFDRID